MAGFPGLDSSSRPGETPGPGVAREERCGEKQWDSGSILKVDKRFATELDVDGRQQEASECVA